MSSPMMRGCLCSNCHKWHDIMIPIEKGKYLCPRCYKKRKGK